MKILYITTIGSTMNFFVPLIKELLERGDTVDIAANEEGSPVPTVYREWGCSVFPLSCSRSPLNQGNRKAVGEIRKIAEDGHYDIVHCHTPIAAACTRLACRGLRRKGVKLIYTAHGFHFYKGAPLKNWLLYYPVEKLCARWTDVLITINKEDYELAKKKLKAGRVEYVPGVGIDVERFAGTVIDKAAKRRELGIPEDAFLLLSVGELNANKNHQIVIKALAQIADPNIHYMIAGRGEKKEELEALAKEHNVNLHLLGYRADVAELYQTADVNVFPSIREGLGMAALEGMASGLPLICSDNRGTRDYATRENSIVCAPMDVSAFTEAISTFRHNAALCDDIGENGIKAAKKYTNKAANERIKAVYSSIAKNITE